MMINTTIKLSIFCTVLLLSGCMFSNELSLNKMCDDSPELCKDLHVISDCRFKRTTLIRARYLDKNQPSEINKRLLLTELDEYESCLELTLYIEYTRNRARKQDRLDNYLRAKELIREEIKETKGTTDPMLAYYLWTHYKDEQAGKVFLSAANRYDVSDPRLLFKLATLKAKSAPQKAIDLFYRAMAMSHSIEAIPATSYVSMMNLFYQQKQFENAYVWALIAKEVDQEDEYPINLELILKKGIRSGDKLITNEAGYKAIADKYYEQLKAGKFNARAPQLK